MASGGPGERTVVGADGVQTLCFYSGFSPLSNFNRSYFSVEKAHYFTVQQYLDAEKARQLHQQDLLARVLNERSPRQCYELTNSELSQADLDRIRWNEQLPGVLETAVRAKFTQSVNHRQHLLATGNQRIAFSTPFDLVLGTGLQIGDSNVGNPQRWTGDNWLGYVLEKVRYELFRPTRPTVPVGKEGNGIKRKAAETFDIGLERAKLSKSDV